MPFHTCLLRHTVEHTGAPSVIFINHIPPGRDLRVEQILKSILISTVARGNKSLSTLPYASS